MKIDQIIDMIEQALITSPTLFEAAANGNVKGAEWCADRMPESWIVACVMQEVQRIGISAFPEVRVRQDIEYFEAGGESIHPDKLPSLKKGGAKIDLLLGDKSLLDGHIHLRVALEIKGPKSNWQQFRADIERLSELHKVAHEDDQVMIFVYVTCPLLDTERKAEEQKLEQSTGLKLSQFRVSSAAKDSLATNGVRRSHVYMHIMSGKK